MLTSVNAIITGASQGLGKAIAEQFLDQGARVVICARDGAALEAAAKELGRGEPGRVVLSHTCDVSDPADVARLVEFAADSIGPLNVLVANAGIYGPMGPTESVDLGEWMRAIEINLYGVLLPCRAIIPHLKRAEHGRIVVVSGGGATSPLPNISAYAASKAAVVRLMETLAEELRPDGIGVNALAPCALATRLVDQVIAAGPEKVGEAFYRKNLEWKESSATPLELGAGLAAYLASPASAGVTGKLISAQWDPWATLDQHLDDLEHTDVYCLRRIVPADRGMTWG